MQTWVAAEIRKGIVLANQVMRHQRVAPKLTPFGFRGARSTDSLPLWERAYWHAFSSAIKTGRLRPPSGPATVQPVRPVRGIR